MKKNLIFLLLVSFIACSPKLTDEQKAALYIQTARQLIEQNQLNTAKLELDSIHTLYPRQVPMRRIAKYLSDSIEYIESKRTLTYCDSMLIIKKAEAEVLVKFFRLEKNEKYQDTGNYVYKLLRTENNAERCFLQSYVSEKADVTLKSTYCGKGAIGHTNVELSANGMTVNSGEIPITDAANHTFSIDGLTWEMVSFKEDAALSLLNFISANLTERIKVTLYGKKSYIYYLSDSEKKALGATYHFAIVMRDIAQLETEIKKANYKIAKFEN